MSNLSEARCASCHRMRSDVFNCGPMESICTSCAWDLDTIRLTDEQADRDRDARAVGGTRESEERAEQERRGDL